MAGMSSYELMGRTLLSPGRLAKERGLSAEEISGLDAYWRREGVSISEMVRRGLRLLLREADRT